MFLSKWARVTKCCEYLRQCEYTEEKGEAALSRGLNFRLLLWLVPVLLYLLFLPLLYPTQPSPAQPCSRSWWEGVWGMCGCRGADSSIWATLLPHFLPAPGHPILTSCKHTHLQISVYQRRLGYEGEGSAGVKPPQGCARGARLLETSRSGDQNSDLLIYFFRQEEKPRDGESDVRVCAFLCEAGRFSPVSSRK